MTFCCRMHIGVRRVWAACDGRRHEQRNCWRTYAATSCHRPCSKDEGWALRPSAQHYRRNARSRPESHMIIDEIGTKQEVTEAVGVKQRGVQLIATTHGRNLSDVILNPLCAMCWEARSFCLLKSAKKRGRNPRHATSAEWSLHLMCASSPPA